ncbi:hypothetical protein GWI33_007767 [Rhynchophorus ferrugineus]|uniref:Myb/SANT-like DNA-binding domain-containing protein n=1 Tax=Rhynchophorus ferrugineus TaxID=354439 RepID=A0A834J2B7_RHYFE|nr:hypothetical protein GWI33_007767 [Rhynchophorus ferrugineus]
MDFKNVPKKRTTNFREDETKLLIQLWGSPTVQNKLYLTHRKAPVMRLIAANMQKHGFYRTPDEIKTRIRNLKCLYHRIKKSMTTGTGIGTVDPDWPHYKAMDEILSRKNAIRQSLVYNHNLLSEVNSETTVKQEIEDIDINDDVESYTSNSNGSDDEFEETPAMPATVTPLIIEEDEKVGPIKIAPKPSVPATSSSSTTPITYPRIQIAQNLMNTPSVSVSKGTPVSVNKSTNSTIPFPLLILNGVPNGVQSVSNGTPGLVQKTVTVSSSHQNLSAINSDTAKILKDILEVQRENLEIEKERLEIEKQKLNYERTIGSQFLNIAPIFNDILQKFRPEPEESIAHEIEEEDTKNFEGHPNYQKIEQNGRNKRPTDDLIVNLRNSKIFKDAILGSIKKHMQEGGGNDNEGGSDIT